MPQKKRSYKRQATETTAPNADSGKEDWGSSHLPPELEGNAKKAEKRHDMSMSNCSHFTPSAVNDPWLYIYKNQRENRNMLSCKEGVFIPLLKYIIRNLSY